MLLLIIATVFTFVFCGFAFYNARMKLPVTIIALALIDLYLVFVWGIGYIGLAIMGILAIIMAITFKVDNS